MTVPMQDPFQDPFTPPSTHPTIASFRGRLIMVTPKKSDTVPDNLNPGKMVERITADVTVVDGLGPVPLMKGNPPQPTGQYLDGPDFVGVWIQSSYLVSQLQLSGIGRTVLGIIDTKTPGTNPGKGNPYGITAASPQQKQQAMQFLASRTVGAAAAPAPVPQPQAAPTYPRQDTVQPAPVYGAPVGSINVPNPFTAANPAPTQVQAPNPFAAAAPSPQQAYPQQAAPVAGTPAAPSPAPVTQAVAPAVPAPGSAPAGVNPFA